MFQRSTIHASDISLFCITTTALLVVANDGLQVTDMSSTKRQQRAPGRTPFNRLDDIIYIRVPQDTTQRHALKTQETPYGIFSSPARIQKYIIRGLFGFP
jgi:hypothetical protein